MGCFRHAFVTVLDSVADRQTDRQTRTRSIDTANRCRYIYNYRYINIYRYLEQATAGAANGS